MLCGAGENDGGRTPVDVCTIDFYVSLFIYMYILLPSCFSLSSACMPAQISIWHTCSLYLPPPPLLYSSLSLTPSPLSLSPPLSYSPPPSLTLAPFQLSGSITSTKYCISSVKLSMTAYMHVLHNHDIVYYYFTHTHTVVHVMYVP